MQACVLAADVAPVVRTYTGAMLTRQLGHQHAAAMATTGIHRVMQQYVCVQYVHTCS